MGYSGGAEFITYELNADRQGTWRSGGGSILVAGGGCERMQTEAPQNIKNQPMYWWVGAADTSVQRTLQRGAPEVRLNRATLRTATAALPIPR